MSGNPQFPSNNELHSSPENFYSWLATITLQLPPSFKAAIFFKEKCWVSTPYIEMVYELNEEDNPHLLGYIYPNERNEIMTKVYQVYWSIYEVDDNKNQNRNPHVYSDNCFKRYRRFKDSSIITDIEAIRTISNIFAQWPHTMGMWNKVDSMRPKGTTIFFR